ncbi:hydroxyethylthiazole kinase [Enterococcus sp. LJL99]
MKTFILSSIKKIHTKKPLIHHITNYVTVNDCANITLAIGASPIMADDRNEVAEIIEHSNALVINIGTLNDRTIPSMISAGKAANKKQIPVILDPVGVGASTLRNETVKKLLKEIRFTVIKGNRSEIRFLAGATSNTNGVDASAEDLKREIETQLVAKKMAKKYQCIIAITGEIDIVTNGDQMILIENGCEKMSHITGTGCMSASLIAVFCACHPNQSLYSTAVALISMGIAGEQAANKTINQGTGSLRTAIIDKISLLEAEKLIEKGIFYEN